MRIEVDRDFFEDVARQVDVEEIIEDGHRYFKGATNRPFPAFSVDREATQARFLVLLGTYAGDPDCTDIDEDLAMRIAGAMMTESLGQGMVVGFPGVELVQA
jgi:hypothetical protein